MSDPARRRARGGRRPGAPRSPRRRGAALLAAVAAIVVLTALAVGLVLATRYEQRAARELLAGERALAAAELALAGVAGEWRGVALDSLGIGRSSARAAAAGGGDAVVLRVTRATASTVWAVAEGRSGVGAGRARRAAAMLFRVHRGPGDSAFLRPVTRRAWVQTF